MDELMEELDIPGIKDLEIEDLSLENHPDQKLISSEEPALNFRLHRDILEEIQWGFPCSATMRQSNGRNSLLSIITKVNIFAPVIHSDIYV